MRAPTDEMLNAMDEALRKACEDLDSAGTVQVAVEQVVYFPPQPFDAEQVESVRSAAQRLELSHMDVVSGAGHDAVYMAHVTPTAMIFIPCKDGISHNEIEDARPEHITAGANVLMHAILDQAGLA